METTLVFLKPDAVQRRLIGPILSRIEQKGLQIVGAKLMKVSRDLAQRHYAEHEGKPFYEELIRFVTSGPVLVLALRGVEAVAVTRKLVGATNGRKAEPGTIRGDFGMSGGHNLIHASDSPESAQRELAMWFSEGELVDDEPALNRWVYSPSDLG
ncbi:MAG TPA: nucleoside-diphosphate kinase [Phycisphaeraceae bacterium]